jgi:outer membrane protein OmpA-like peptidoglycan-associated protein
MHANINPTHLEKMTKFRPSFILLTALFLAVTATVSFGQSIKAFERAAEKSAAQHDYYTAIRYLENALTIDSQRLDLIVRHGEFSQLFGAPSLAAESFQKVLSRDLSGKYVAVFKNLAESEKNQGKYEAAIQHFQNYLDKNTAATAAEKEAVNQAILDCDWAVSMLANPDPTVLIERLNEGVNTPLSEFAPIKKGDTLFYSAFQQIDWKDKNYPPRPIVKVMQTIGDALPTETSFNDPARHTAHTAFSPKGDVMIYTLCDYVGTVDIRCQLYLRHKIGENWSAPEKLPTFINDLDATTTQPNLAFGIENGKLTLLFASDRAGGRGKMDIWSATQNSNGQWDAPINLAALNTEGNDITPFYEANSQTIFYSTDGKRSLGGYDIYKSQRNALVGGPSADVPNNEWAEPENVGLPFNSPGNDLYFMDNGLGEVSFFASNRAGTNQFDKEACCYDIFRTKLLPLQLEAFVFTKTGQTPILGVDVKLIEMKGATDSKQNTGGDNQADFEVGRNRQYMIIATKEGFSADTVILTTQEIPVNRIFRSTLFLDIPKKDEPKDPNWNKKDPKLTPGWLNQFLPVTLYYDNDEPNRNSWATTTATSYDESFVKYISRKEDFLRIYTRGMVGEQKIQSQTDLADFFESDVQKGYDRLAVFAKSLQRFLDSGYDVEIIIKGYASPLAKNNYNQNLTLRRSACVLNYMAKAEGGIYQKYINDGRLVLTTVGFGEEKSKAGVNDNARDTRQSIFSPDASRERRAEIIEVKLLKQ